MSNYEHHVSFEPFTQRDGYVWRAKVHIVRRLIWSPQESERHLYEDTLDLGWYWSQGKAWNRAAAYRDNAERISRLAGHIVERESHEQEDPSA
jgi:hypothetical protein